MDLFALVAAERAARRSGRADKPTPKCDRCHAEEPSNAADGFAHVFRVTCPGCRRKVFGCCSTTGHTGKGSRCLDCAAA